MYHFSIVLVSDLSLMMDRNREEYEELILGYNQKADLYAFKMEKVCTYIFKKIQNMP